jgi:hypothetical protein
VWAKTIVWGVARPGSETCKTNPISPARTDAGGEMRKTNPIWTGRGRTPEARCAKRSQTWGDWGVWANAVVLWGGARLGTETCETNPIWPSRGPGPEAKCAKRTQFRTTAEDVGRGRPTYEEQKSAKRTQTWWQWGIWAKAVVVWGAARAVVIAGRSGRRR